MLIRSLLLALAFFAISSQNVVAQSSTSKSTPEAADTATIGAADRLYSVQFRIFADGRLYAAPTAVVRLGEKTLIAYNGDQKYSLEFSLLDQDASASATGSLSNSMKLSAILGLPPKFPADAEFAEALSPAIDINLGQQVEMTSDVRGLYLANGSKRGVIKSLRFEAIVSASELTAAEVEARAEKCGKIASEAGGGPSDYRISGPGFVADSRACCSSGNLTCCWGRQCCSDGKTGNGCCI